MLPPARRREVVPMDVRFDAATRWKLRVAASLSTALPVRVLVTDGPVLLFEVRRPPTPADPGRMVLPPCWFRTLVTSARSPVLPGVGPLTEAMMAARQLGIAPVLDHRGASLPGGIWRLDHPASATYLFATGLRPCAARGALGTDPDVAALEPGYLLDPATDVTLVSATTGPAADPATTLDVVTGMLARCTPAARPRPRPAARPPCSGPAFRSPRRGWSPDRPPGPSWPTRG